MKRPLVLLLALIIVITLIALPTITYPLGRDQGEFATIGRGLLDGRIPYVDLWNPKPPAVFYVYALAMKLFGRTTGALRVIDLFLLPPIALTLYWIGKRLANVRVGLWAVLLFGVFYFTETFWTLTQNDGIVLLPMVLATATAIKSADSRLSGRPASPVWAFASGALFAYAIWYKYPFAIFIGVTVFAYIWARHISPSPPPPLPRKADVPTSWGEGRILRDILAYAAGGLLIGLGGIAYLMSIGAWDALVQSALVTASYTVLGLSGVVDSLRTSFGFRVQLWGVLFLLALIGLVLALRRFNRRSLWWIALVWLIVGTAMMLVQLKFYDYHWLPMLPPLALIGAGVIEALVGLFPSPRLTNRRSAFPLPLTERGEKDDHEVPSPQQVGASALRGRGDLRVRRYVRGVIALALLAAMTTVIGSRTFPYLTGCEDQVTYYSHFQAGEFVADESLEVANFLRQRVAPGDSLFIWGFRPEVYYLSQLNPAVRFIFQFPLVANWYPPEWRKQTVDTLWAALPPYVLVLQVDYMPWVTGNNEDSNTDLQGYTELNNWLEFNYVRDSQIGNFILWRRTSIPK